MYAVQAFLHDNKQYLLSVLVEEAGIHRAQARALLAPALMSICDVLREPDDEALLSRAAENPLEFTGELDVLSVVYQARVSEPMAIEAMQTLLPYVVAWLEEQAGELEAIPEVLDREPGVVHRWVHNFLPS